MYLFANLDNIKEAAKAYAACMLPYTPTESKAENIEALLKPVKHACKDLGERTKKVNQIYIKMFQIKVRRNLFLVCIAFMLGYFYQYFIGKPGAGFFTNWWDSFKWAFFPVTIVCGFFSFKAMNLMVKQLHSSALEAILCSSLVYDELFFNRARLQSELQKNTPDEAIVSLFFLRGYIGREIVEMTNTLLDQPVLVTNIKESIYFQCYKFNKTIVEMSNVWDYSEVLYKQLLEVADGKK